MKIPLVLLALVAAIQAEVEGVFPLSPIEIQFKEYQEKYKKTYACLELEALRFYIFKSHVREIEEHNKENSTWKMGINQFTDMREYEINNGLLIEPPTALDPIKIQFEEFKKNYTREYGCPEEEEVRFKIFKHNLEEIEEHNKEYAEGKVTWTIGINQFTDRVGEELRHFFGAVLHKHKPPPLSGVEWSS